MSFCIAAVDTKAPNAIHRIIQGAQRPQMHRACYLNPKLSALHGSLQSTCTNTPHARGTTQEAAETKLTRAVKGLHCCLPVRSCIQVKGHDLAAVKVFSPLSTQISVPITTLSFNSHLPHRLFHTRMSSIACTTKKLHSTTDAYTLEPVINDNLSLITHSSS
jgi:hypothetical protein